MGFLVVARDGDISQVGNVSAAFYAGLALGRFVLAEPTFRFGEKRMFLIYGIVILILEVILWKVPNVVVDAVMVPVMGFLLEPAFATVGIEIAYHRMRYSYFSGGVRRCKAYPIRAATFRSSPDFRHGAGWWSYLSSDYWCDLGSS